MWTAEVVDIAQTKDPLIVDVKVIFTNSLSADKVDAQVFHISNLDDLPRVCWNQIAQHEKVDDIANSKTKMGPVDVSEFRPKPVAPPDPIEVAWHNNYHIWKQIKLAIAQGLETESQEFIDLEKSVLQNYRTTYRTFLFP
jgi:hypothetical protein